MIRNPFLSFNSWICCLWRERCCRGAGNTAIVVDGRRPINELTLSLRPLIFPTFLDTEIQILELFPEEDSLPFPT